MSAPTGVLFDLDGTLADTPAAIVTITAQVVARAGAPADEATIRSLVGKPLDQNFAFLLGRPAEDPAVADAMASYRRAFADHLDRVGPGMLFDDVDAGLAELRRAGLPLAVVTSKTESAARRTLEVTGIAGHFDVVLGHDNVQAGKPDPEMALTAAARLGVEPGGCVVVGDAVGDIGMAVAAHMAGLGVSFGVASPAELLGAGADAVVDSFDAVVETLVAGTP